MHTASVTLLFKIILWCIQILQNWFWKGQMIYQVSTYGLKNDESKMKVENVINTSSSLHKSSNVKRIVNCQEMKAVLKVNLHMC